MEALTIEKQFDTTFLTFFKTSGNRHRLLICCLVGFMCQWSGNGIVTYYLSPILAASGVTDTSTQAIINVCLNMWNYPWAIAGALSANKLGRRPLFFISTGCMLVCYIVITALSATYANGGNQAVGYATVAFLFLFFGRSHPHYEEVLTDDDDCTHTSQLLTTLDLRVCSLRIQLKSCHTH